MGAPWARTCRSDTPRLQRPGRAGWAWVLLLGACGPVAPASVRTIEAPLQVERFVEGEREVLDVAGPVVVGDFDGIPPPEVVVGVVERIEGPDGTYDRSRLYVTGWSGGKLKWPVATYVEVDGLTASTDPFADAHTPGRGLLAVGDFDGDGFDDLAVRPSAGNPPGVRLFRGGSEGLQTAPDAVQVLDLDVGADDYLAAAGDVDGDGYDDLLVRSAGQVAVYWGDADAPLLAREPATVTRSAGAAPPVPAGDLDGDGWGDLVGVGLTAVWIYHWSSGELVETSVPASWAKDLGWSPLSETQATVVRSPDVDGDGTDELWVAMITRGVPDYPAPAPAGFVARVDATVDAVGGPAELLRAGSDAEERWGRAIAVVDLDGDGLLDLVVGAPGAYSAGQGRIVAPGDTVGGRVVLLRGQPDGELQAVAQGTQIVYVGNDGRLGEGVQVAGDVDADGYPDVLVWARGWKDSPSALFGMGALYLVRGGPDAFDGELHGVWPPYAQPPDGPPDAEIVADTDTVTAPDGAPRAVAEPDATTPDGAPATGNGDGADGETQQGDGTTPAAPDGGDTEPSTGAGGGCGGCQVVTPGAPWPAMLVPLTLWGWRRLRRGRRRPAAATDAPDGGTLA